MIVCPSCSNESPDEAVFCGYCGNKLGAEGPKNTIFGLAAIPEKATKKQPEPPPPEPVEDDEIEGWDLDDDDDDVDLGNPTIQSPAVKPDLLGDLAGASDVDLGFDADLGNPTIQTTAVPAPEEKAPAKKTSRPKLDLKADFASKLKGEPEPKKAGVSAPIADSRPEPKHEPKIVLTPEVRKEPKVQVAPEPRAKPKQESAPSYPAPVPAGGKENEEEFFGATLSQYGLAPIIEKPFISDEEIGSELKRANRSGAVMVILALLVLALIAGAIAFFVLYAKPDG